MTAQPRFEAMTIGMILDQCFRLYSQNFTLVLGLVAVTYGPFWIFVTAAMFTGGNYWLIALESEEPSPAMLAIFFGAVILVVLVWQLVIQPLTTGALTTAISKRYLNEEVSIGQAYKTTWKRFGTLLWSYIVVGLFIMLGMFLCIVPGIILMICFAALTPVIMLEDQNSADSRSRAWQLLEGYRWKAFAVLLILWLITVAVGMGFNLVGLFLPQEGAFFIALGFLLDLCGNLITAPLIIIGPILLYYDARIRKEGFDLDMLANSLHEEFDAPPTNG